MTTNQQIDKIIAVLYEYQVKQKQDWTQLPDYADLCNELFAEVKGLNENHHRNLLYMLTSKKLIEMHADSLTEAFNKPISLRPEVIGWYEQFQSYLDYLDYLEQKNQPKAFLEELDEPDSEDDGRQAALSKIPVWVKVFLLIAAIIAIVVITMGYGKA